MSILLIHGAGRQNHSLLSSLEEEYGQVECVHSPVAALKLACERRFDAFILDVRRSSFEPSTAVCDLRSHDPLAVIMVLASQPSLQERIRLLESGADDCLNEPLSEKELAVRLRVVLRRTALLAQRLCAGDLELDGVRRQATRQGKLITLTPREFAVLECLLRNAGRPVSRTRIFEEVWNREGTTTNIVDVYINYLRAKVDRGFEPKLIRTVYGLGYVLASEQRRTA